jgi:nitrite reductase/ring-hydroxylating ferredoxin subunit
MAEMKDSWVCIGERDKIQPDMPLTVENGERGVGVYELDGELYALEDLCPHAFALLSQGFVQDGKVECPLHAAIFDIRTGACVEGPGGRNLETYPVELRDNKVYVQIDMR